jgi:hypothetical protein
METMTLMPMAAVQVLDGRALPLVRASWTIGMTGHVSVNTNVTCTAPAASTKFRHFGTKAYGTRRLGEHAST